MVTPITVEGKFQEDSDLIYADEYIHSRGNSKKRLHEEARVRRLICRVCKLKFRTRQETQTHIKREHRRL